MSMWCYQCQEAAGGVACQKVKGICGKKEVTANLQDVLLDVAKGISFYSTKARENNVDYDFKPLDAYINDALFVCITNANFDDGAIIAKINEGLPVKEGIKKAVESAGVDLSNAPEAAIWIPKNNDDIKSKAEVIWKDHSPNEDVKSLRELIVNGVKGAAAYNQHANHLGKYNNEVPVFLQKALSATLDDSVSVEDLIALTLETGKAGVNAMAILDEANNSAFGTPEMTEVKLGVSDKPGILVSGHDLRDIKQLLDQTEGTGIDVYTHCEMLPTHYYPELKKYKHLIGNYGGAWWDQEKDFTAFNGPILFTTNCIVPPKSGVTYADKIFTTGSSGLAGSLHIKGDSNGNKDFTSVIEAAKKCAPPKEIESGTITGGFAHAQVLALADKVVDAVKSGAISKFVVMGGCDGRFKSREYYTDFAEALPKDTVILTAGCAKFRYNKLNLGDIGGIPRMLDAGQCNDSYSLAMIALKLKEVFELDDINDLPIVYNIAWYEQKAVIVLLALLYLGVKNIHLGPTLPAFLSPNVATVLVENFGIGGISTVENDIEEFLA